MFNHRLIAWRPCARQHWDHAGGNEELAQKLGDVEVIGGYGDSIPAVTREVKHGDTVTVGSLKVASVSVCSMSPQHGM